MTFRLAVFLLSFCGCLWQWFAALAQQTPVTSPPAEPPKAVSPGDLRDGQMAISGRYARFERMLSQMADILGRQDPDRADLLRRAIGKGREDQVREDIESIVELLSGGELGTATEKQVEVVASLESLLKLLQSEDRRSSVERERERLNNLLKDVRGIMAEQKSARAETQNSQAPSSATPGQQKAVNKTDDVLKQMQEHDDRQAKEDQKSSPSDSDAEPSSEDNKNSDSKDGKGGDSKAEKSGDKSSKDGKSKDGEKNQDESSENPSGDSKSEDQSQNQDGDSSKKQGSDSSKSKGGKSGRKSGGQKQAGQDSKPTPGKEELQRAREQMEQALEELKQQQKDEALEHQDEALEELRQAQEKLEEMLQQLREEEKEMMLASLEARFQRMLIVETQIHEGTVTLAATPQKDWLDQYYGRCRELAQQQSELSLECAQTVNLLREDGTSVAILMAVEDIEADMTSVASWLQESRVADLTQTLQTDIIEALRQLIETTQQEMQEMKDQQHQEQQQQQSGKENQKLVALMAEIRMLRNLQLQVNKRTKQVDSLLQTAPAEEQPGLQKQVRELAVRQRRLMESARELSKQAQ